MVNGRWRKPPELESDAAALARLEEIVWPNGPVCTHCGERDRLGRVVGRGARLGLRFCNNCRKQFRVTLVTPFAGRRLPMHKWFSIAALRAAGFSARQIHLRVKLSYKTVLAAVVLIDAGGEIIQRMIGADWGRLKS